MFEGKIFLCGLSRTGKNSINSALLQMGFGPSVRFPWEYNDIIQNQIASDLSVICWLDKIVIDYPNSKWILSLRNIDLWLDECEIFFSRSLDYLSHETKKSMLTYRANIYGNINFDRELWFNSYLKHCEKVRNIIPKSNLLEIDLKNVQKNAWIELQDFLQVEIDHSHLEFPHLNSIDQWEKFDEI